MARFYKARIWKASSPAPPKPLQPAPMLPDLPGTQREGEFLSGLSIDGNPRISSMGLDTSDGSPLRRS